MAGNAQLQLRILHSRVVHKCPHQTHSVNSSSCLGRQPHLHPLVVCKTTRLALGGMHQVASRRLQLSGLLLEAGWQHLCRRQLQVLSPISPPYFSERSLCVLHASSSRWCCMAVKGDTSCSCSNNNLDAVSDSKAASNSLVLQLTFVSAFIASLWHLAQCSEWLVSQALLSCRDGQCSASFQRLTAFGM